MFVVFDIFKSLKEEFFTLANLWHTRKILSRGDHWYDTVYDRSPDTGEHRGHRLPPDKHLLIVFPARPTSSSRAWKPQKRHYQDELTIHQTTGQHFELRETVGFVTVLIPHAAKDDPQELAAQSQAPGRRVGPRAGQGIQIEVVRKDLFQSGQRTTCART